MNGKHNIWDYPFYFFETNGLQLPVRIQRSKYNTLPLYTMTYPLRINCLFAHCWINIENTTFKF